MNRFGAARFTMTGKHRSLIFKKWSESFVSSDHTWGVAVPCSLSWPGLNLKPRRKSSVKLRNFRSVIIGSSRAVEISHDDANSNFNHSAGVPVESRKEL